MMSAYLNKILGHLQPLAWLVVGQWVMVNNYGMLNLTAC